MHRFTSVNQSQHNRELLTPITYQIAEADSEHTRTGLRSDTDTIQLATHSKIPFILCITSQSSYPPVTQSHFLTIPYIRSFYLTLHNKTTAYHKYCGWIRPDFKVATIAKFTRYCCALARSHSHFIHSIVYPPPHHFVHRTYTKRSPSSPPPERVHQNDQQA